MGKYQGGTGIVPKRDFELSSDAREYITNLVVSAGITFDGAPFFERLNAAARIFIGSAELERTSGASARHRNLVDALKAAEGLSQSLSALDGNAKLIIEDVGGSASSLARDTRTIVRLLKAAVAVSKKNPAGGVWPPGQYQFEFAAEIESAFLELSDYVPTGAAGGPFATVLAAVIAEIRKVNIGSATKLAKAVAGQGIRVKESDGVVWYRQVSRQKKH